MKSNSPTPYRSKALAIFAVLAFITSNCGKDLNSASQTLSSTTEPSCTMKTTAHQTSTIRIEAAPKTIEPLNTIYKLSLFVDGLNTKEKVTVRVALKDPSNNWQEYGATEVSYPNKVKNFPTFSDTVKVALKGLPQRAVGLIWEVKVLGSDQKELCYIKKENVEVKKAGTPINGPLFFDHPIDSYSKIYQSGFRETKTLSVGPISDEPGAADEIYLEAPSSRGYYVGRFQLNLKTGTLYFSKSQEERVIENLKLSYNDPNLDKNAYKKALQFAIEAITSMAEGENPWMSSEQTNLPELATVVDFLTAVDKSLN
jgi:hypothetical protein